MRNLCSAISHLTSALIHRISQDVDVKYQLLWNFGGYLAGIPRRLGHSACLDAAADALVSSHTGLCAGALKAGSTAWAKYSRALSVLRHDLNDVAKARSSESLCAVMVLSIVQLLMDPNSGFYASHTTGAARIMKSRGREWSIINEQGRKPQTDPDGRWFNCLAAVPDLIQRCQSAIRLHRPPSSYLLSLEFETRGLLHDCEQIITVLRGRLQKLDTGSIPSGVNSHLHALYLKSLGLALGTGIILHLMLSGLEGMPHHVSEESSLWSEEIVRLSRLAVKYQPLGAMAMTLCLQFAWLGAPNADAKVNVETLLCEYNGACLGDPWIDHSLQKSLGRFTFQDV
ncbi:MAG: hypothetical protein Q9219_002637 [cf. Caloplaca sp. 3 TL-2023]